MTDIHTNSDIALTKIKTLITQNKLLKGNKLPNERLLSEIINSKRAHVRNALLILEKENINFIIKPTSSIKSKGKTVNTKGKEVDIEVTGRHDPCVGIRAVPIAEAMANLVIMDHFLRNRAQCGEINQKLPFTE